VVAPVGMSRGQDQDGTGAGLPPVPLAVVVKGWPRLSETFIAQELRGLELRGLALTIVSLRQPHDRACHPLHREVEAPLLYLPEYLHQEPWRLLAALLALPRQPGWRRALAVWLADLRRDPSRNRLRRFGQACVLARELPGTIGHLHAHFLHTPASVARYAALLRGHGWSFSAHAKDIWTTPAWELRGKLAEAAWGVTCTRAGWDYLRTLAAEPARLELVYHGLDFSRFPAAAPALEPAPRRGDDPARPVRLLSVGRAVAKKGLDLVLAALARLPPGLHWHWTHVGAGPLLGELQQQAARLGLAGRIHWCGALAQEAVIGHYRQAELFLLPCREAADGDRDGLPNVLMEAQALGLACLSTTCAAVPELIEPGRTGELVPPEDAAALATALEALCRDPARRLMLAQAGYRRVRRDFASSAGLDRLAERLRQLARPSSRAIG